MSKLGTTSNPVRYDDADVFGAGYVFGEGDSRLPRPYESEALGTDDLVTMTHAAVWRIAIHRYPKAANRPGGAGYSDEKRMLVLKDWMFTHKSLRQIARDHHMAPATIARMTEGIARPPKEKEKE